MNGRFVAILLALACICCAEEKSHEHEHKGEGHEGHNHGGPLFQGETSIAVSLTAGGTILVALTLLAILWKPIDGAFRRSRLRARWERRSTRVTFAIGTLILASTVVGGITYLRMDHADHDHHDGEPAPLRPIHGGVVTNAGGFVFEMVARRTGEMRLYLTPLEGQQLSRWDFKGEVTIPSSAFSPAANVGSGQVVPLAITYDGSYFGAYALPFEAKRFLARVSLKIKDQTFQLEFNLPVED